MFRIISFFVITSFVSITLYFYNESRHHHDHESLSHSHNYIEIPNENLSYSPTLDGTIYQENSGIWIVELNVNNFSFVREKASFPDLDQHYDTGHAHLYINGEKIESIFDTRFHIYNLEQGFHDIKVSLNSHNHEVYTLEGKEIAFEKTIYVPN